MVSPEIDIPNRVTGESLPGVCFVTDVKPFHDFIKRISSLEEAKTKAEITEPSIAGDVVPAPDYSRSHQKQKRRCSGSG